MDSCEFSRTCLMCLPRVLRSFISIAGRSRTSFVPQAFAGMPSSAESFSERHQVADVLCHHRPHADQSVDWSQTNTSDARDDLLVLPRHGQRRRTAGTSRSTAEAAPASKNNDLSSRGNLSASPATFHAARIKCPLEFRRRPSTPPD